MLITIPSVLQPEELQSVRTALADAPFVDGRLTAGQTAREVKHNEELDRGSQLRDVLARALIGSLYRSETFRLAVIPHRIATPLFARYAPGMSYGDHVDEPVMGEPPNRYRSDVSITVFLSGPEDYEGGELVVRTSYGAQKVKLAAGDAVAYPSSSIHHVAEVTAGERLACVLWVQSLVRDPGRRELLYELGMAREGLLRQDPDSREAGWVDRSYANLIRLWSEL